MDKNAQAILDFWLTEVGEDGWYLQDAALDARIRDRFLPLWERAHAGELAEWTLNPRATLALLVLLDQFPRNLHRGTAAAFGGDDRALALARRMVQQGWDRDLSLEERWFAYLPFEHSEGVEDQRESLRLFAALARDGLPEPLIWAERHAEVIARFGRYPHRNEALGRASTAAELDYLAQPGAGF